MACAIGWAATCAAYIAIGRAGTFAEGLKISSFRCVIGSFGLIVAIAMILMKIVPAVPGHFTVYEWLALGGWSALGAVARRREVL